MKILLDTHMLLWAFTDDPMLSADAIELISNNENEIFYSTLSIWEIALKHALHPNMLLIDEENFLEYCSKSGFSNIVLTNAHVRALSQLKSTDETNHKDPFDRMLMAQAISEQMVFLTQDRKLQAYKSDLIRVL